MTRWFVRAGEDYPDGLIDILPSREGGLPSIFPHQLHGPVPPDAPYRGDKICVATDTGRVLRTLDEAEPRAAVDRLAWHVNRAVGWIKGASEGTLLAPGAHFELPFYPDGRHAATSHSARAGRPCRLGRRRGGVGTADVARLDTAGGPWRW